MKTLLLTVLLAAPPYGPDDPVPPNAIRTVLALESRSLALHVDGSGLAGRVESMRTRETATEIRIELAADVLFGFDRADLEPDAKATLAKAAAIVKERARDGALVRVEGHTDSKGSDAYNQALSEKRARAVASWLKENGASSARYEVAGFGAKKPIVPNTKKDGSDDPDGRAKNRRVEIAIRK